MQVCNHVPHILSQLFDLALGRGEVGLEESDSMDGHIELRSGLSVTVGARTVAVL